MQSLKGTPLSGGRRRRTRRRRTRKNKRRRKRRTRKRNRRSRKNKKSRKHKRSKKGRGIGPFGKQKLLSSENKPKTGDKVRVRGQAGWTVITPMNRAAIVCPPGNTSSNQCSFGEQEIRYNEMTKMGFMGQMGLKKAGGTKNKKSKKRNNRKRKTRRKKRKTRRKRR